MTRVHTRVTADASNHISQFERANASVLRLEQGVKEYNKAVGSILAAGGAVAAFQAVNDEISATINHYNHLIGIQKGANFFGSISEARAMSQGLKDLATNAEASYAAMRLNAAGAELMTRQFRELGQATRGLNIATNMSPQDALMRFQGFLIRGETEALEATGVSIKLNDLYDRYARQQGLRNRFQLGAQGEMAARTQELFNHPAFQRMRAFGADAEATTFQQLRTLKQEAVDRFVMDLAGSVDTLAKSLMNLDNAAPRDIGERLGRIASSAAAPFAGAVGVGAMNLMFSDRQNMMRNMLANQMGYAGNLDERITRAQDRLQVASFRRQDLQNRFNQGLPGIGDQLDLFGHTGIQYRFDQTTVGARALASEDAARARLAGLRTQHQGITREVERGNAALRRSQQLYMGLVGAEIAITALVTVWQLYSTAVRDAAEAQAALKRNQDETIRASREVGGIVGATTDSDVGSLLKRHAEDLGLKGGALDSYSQWIDNHIEQLKQVKQGTKEYEQAIQDVRQALVEAQLGEDAQTAARTAQTKGRWEIGKGLLMQGLGVFNNTGIYGQAQMAVGAGLLTTDPDEIFRREAEQVLRRMMELDELDRLRNPTDPTIPLPPTAYEKMSERLKGLMTTSAYQQGIAFSAGLPTLPIARDFQQGIDRLLLGADASQFSQSELQQYGPQLTGAMQRETERAREALRAEIAATATVNREKLSYAREMDALRRAHGLEDDRTQEQVEIQRQYNEILDRNTSLLQRGEDAMREWVAEVPDWAQQVQSARTSLQQMEAAQLQASQALNAYTSTLQQRSATAGAIVGAESSILAGAAGANRFDAQAVGLIGQIREVGLIDAQMTSLQNALGRGGLQPSARKMLEDQLSSLGVQRTQTTGGALGALLGFAGNMQDIPEDQWRYVQEFLKGPYAAELESLAPHLYAMAQQSGINPSVLQRVQDVVGPYNILGGNAAALGAEFGNISSLSPEIHLVNAMGSLEQSIKNLTAAITGDPSAATATGPNTPRISIAGQTVTTGGGPLSPLAGGQNVVNSFFKSNRPSGKHGGIDIMAPAGTDMVAYEDLVALTNPYNAGKNYGMMQGFLDSRGNVVYYVHGTGFTAKKGDKVPAGALVGSVYDMKNPHLDMKFMSKAEWDEWQAAGGGGLPPWRRGLGFDPLATGYLGPVTYSKDGRTATIQYGTATSSQTIMPAISIAGRNASDGHAPAISIAAGPYRPAVNIASFPYGGVDASAGMPAGLVEDWYLPCNDPMG